MRKTEYDPIPHALAVQARAVAQAAPEIRVAKLEAARRALQEGTLTLDGPTLAKKLLEGSRTCWLRIIPSVPS